MKALRWVSIVLSFGFALFVCPPTLLHAAPFAYITNYAANSVSVIDTATNTVTATVPVGNGPTGVAVHPAGTRVYVTNLDGNSVSVLDAATNTVTAAVPVGTWPLGVAALPAGTRVYVANALSASVSVIDTAANGVTTTILLPYDAAPFGVAAHPDGTRVYVTDGVGNRVFVLDTATNTVTATVPVGSGPIGVAVHPAGTRVYVTNLDGNSVSVLDAATNTVTAAVPVGTSPAAIAVHPAGTRVYVGNEDSSTLSVLETATNTVIATVSLDTPEGVAVHPDGMHVYVTNQFNNTVSVVATATNTVTATIPVGTSPVAFGQFIGPDVRPDVRDRIGAFRPSDGTFYLDANGSGTWEGCGTDKCLQIGMVGDVALVGDWNGSGTSKVGAFRPSDGTFYLDYNGNGTWESCGVDRCLQIGMNGDIPLVGDWNGSGTSKVGAFRPTDGTFYLDYNGSGTWDGCGVDRCLQIGMSGDIPLVGDWSGSGTSKVGAFRPTDGTFYLDHNGSGTWEGCGVDRCLQIGLNGDIPLVGDWNGSGTSKVGAFRPSDGTFYLDYNGSGTWEGCGTDRCLQIGLLTDTPLVGDWSGSGTTKVGVFRPSNGTFYLDYDGSGTWNGCSTDRCLQFGMSGDTPLVGKW